MVSFFQFISAKTHLAKGFAMKINIRQISELTGFSPATISKALNGKKGIRKETLQIILAAADQLGYHTAEKISKIYLINFQTANSSPSSFFHHFILSGVEKKARESGLETVLVLLDRSSQDFHQSIQELTHDPCAHLILTGTGMTEEDYLLFQNSKNRVVIMDGWSRLCSFPAVAIDNASIALDAVSLLYKNGHRKIGYVRSIHRLQNFQERESGFRNALFQFGIPYRSDYVVDVPIPVDEACFCMENYLLKHPDHPTAFLAENDFIAIAASRGIVQAGYRIPDDISIIGIDDNEYAQLENPPLTTFRIHMESIGELAVIQLLSLPSHSFPKCKTLVSANLVERASVRNLTV